MTSYRFHWRPPLRDGCPTGVLFIRVIHRRRYKDIVRDYRLQGSEWNPVSRDVILPPVAGRRYDQLLAIRASMQQDLERIAAIVEKLTVGGDDHTVYDICRYFGQNEADDSLQSYCAVLAAGLEDNGQVRTGRAYLSAARSVATFAGRSVRLAELNPAFVRSYESYLLDRGLKMNTVSFYMRNLRAVYNRAMKAGMIEGGANNPFADVFTGVHETRRRALDQQELSRLGSLDLTGKGGLKDALDYFMFAFHARGMSFVDLAYLKKSEVNGDTILYKRKKTGFFIEVKVTRPMKRLINSFKKRTKGSPYVFPIIADPHVGHRLQYESGLSRQNKLLKELASMAGIGKTLSTHVARHTWATLAKRMGYGIPLISEALGHRDIKVTSTYLASFERSALDELSTSLSRAVRAA